MATYDSLQTKVRNTSGKTLAFSYLPPHGKSLADGEEATFDGDLLALLSSNPRFKRKLAAFKADLASGRLALVNTPAPHAFDATLDITKVIGVDNGAVVATNPSWGTYSSSIGG